MNVAVILNPAKFVLLGSILDAVSCWSMDVVLDMDLFFYISSKQLLLFLLLENNLNEQKPI